MTLHCLEPGGRLDLRSGFFPFHTLILLSMSFIGYQEKSTRLLPAPPFYIVAKRSAHSGLLESSVLKLDVSRSFRYQSAQAKTPNFFQQDRRVLDLTLYRPHVCKTC
jgi:hypothetical protein